MLHEISRLMVHVGHTEQDPVAEAWIQAKSPSIPAVQAQLHPDAHEEGGLAFNNKELLEKQRSSILELVKTVRFALPAPCKCRQSET